VASYEGQKQKISRKPTPPDQLSAFAFHFVGLFSERHFCGYRPFSPFDQDILPKHQVLCYDAWHLDHSAYSDKPYTPVRYITTRKKEGAEKRVGDTGSYDHD